ncbi:hypothetical protein [Catellatospora paridis]|uniref:hypothetical protein n=1 Tax=Catellatospora paridis TaxID=1617086 RepID=UPI0012D4B531|nr:hypothetical protein [Catellatospora paridis]
MPIKTYTGAAAFPVDTADDVTALVELLGRAAIDERLRNDLGDHFAFVAGTRPEWFRPHQDAVVTEFIDGFDVTFDNLCVLFHGAPDRRVEHLERRLRSRWTYQQAWMLAAIGTEAALTAIAGLVRDGADPGKEFEDSGIWTPATGPARCRFTPHRQVVELRTVSDPAELLTADHPVGLPLDQVVRRPEATPAVWHYLSLRLDQVPGMPDLPADRVHLASPKGSVGWTLTTAAGPDGLWHDETVTFDEPPREDETEVDNSDPRGIGVAVLRPYDSDLVYSNGHVLSTPGVVGTAGGPPIGLYPNPHCRSCDRLMFHVVTVQNYIREYGHGWRTLYLCERCQITTCTATNWN